MPSRRDALKAGGLAAAGVLAGGVVRAGAWTPALFDPPEGTWLQPRYSFGNTGHNPHASPPTENPEFVWSYEVPGSVRALAAGVGKLYVGTRHAVYAFEYGERHARWDRAASGYCLAVSHDVVVAAGDGTVTAFEAGNGETRWRRGGGGFTYSVLADERTAYVSWNDRLAAYAAGSGERQWTLSASDAAFAGFDGGRLLVSGSDLGAYEPRGPLLGVVSDAPTRAWEYTELFELSYPVSTGSYALVGGGGGPAGTTSSVSAVTAAGEREWRTELGNNAGNIATDGERAYVVSMRYGEPEGGYNISDTTTLHALDPASGDELWTFQRPGWFCAPVVADGTVYVGDQGGENGEGYLHALDAASGDRLWTYRDVDGVNVLVAVRESLYVGTDSGRVVELA